MIRPYLKTNHGVLYDMDCIELMAKLRSNIFDMVFADPPFNLGKDYKNGFDDRVGQERYYDWSKIWIEECTRLLKPGGAFFLYAIPEHAIRFANFMSSCGLDFKHWIALTMKGTYPRGNRLYPAHYALLYYTLGPSKTFNKIRIPVQICRHCGKEIKDYGGHRDKLHPDGLNLTDFWDDTSPNRHKKFKVRPGVNELKFIIPERAILISTNPREIVFDPFGGGGSTYEAAQIHDRCWVGTELYDCHHIKSRFIEKYPLAINGKLVFNCEELFKFEDLEYQILRRSVLKMV